MHCAWDSVSKFFSGLSRPMTGGEAGAGERRAAVADASLRILAPVECLVRTRVRNIPSESCGRARIFSS